MKKIRFVLIPLILLAMLFVWLFPQLPGLWWAENYGYVRYNSQLMSDQSISYRELMKFKGSVSMAKRKIEAFWGKQTGNSRIIYCNQQSAFSKLCSSGDGAGCSIGTPWGSWIILNKDGMNADVIAHEMCHIELMNRIGWWKVKTKVPTWLDEGLAMQIDDRIVSEKDSILRYADYKSELETYNNKSRGVKSLKDLETNKQFFGGPAAETRIAYLTAATEVAKILTKISRQDLINRMQNPEGFYP